MYLQRKKGFLLAILLLFALSGCQTAKFQSIQMTEAHETLFEQIRRNPNRHRGKLILVGGEVRGLEYKEWKTEVAFSQVPLENNVHPQLGVAGGDLFYVVFPERLDKFYYKKGKVVTVSGRVIGTRTIEGEVFPLLEVEEVEVWNRLRQDRFPAFGAFLGLF